MNRIPWWRVKLLQWLAGRHAVAINVASRGFIFPPEGGALLINCRVVNDPATAITLREIQSADGGQP